ncbi:MAG: acyl-ACP--UDP-N-acetylglucosamine O-acyltransferase, partial [Roseimicrobium sp.]
MIHPTAIIDSRAEIDPTASIGPYAIIEGPVKLRANVKVEAHAQVLGDATIGAGTVIGRAAIIGADPQDLSFKPETESFTIIGENNVIREQVTIHRGSKTGSATRMGDHNFIMATAHFAHDVQIGNK